MDKGSPGYKVSLRTPSPELTTMYVAHTEFTECEKSRMTGALEGRMHLNARTCFVHFVCTIKQVR